jgi:hypothetical protein
MKKFVCSYCVDNPAYYGTAVYAIFAVNLLLFGVSSCNITYLGALGLQLSDYVL